MIPDTIAGIAARQMRAEGNEERASLLRTSRVPAGGPQPEKYAPYTAKTATVMGNAHGISG